MKVLSSVVVGSVDRPCRGEKSTPVSRCSPVAPAYQRRKVAKQIYPRTQVEETQKTPSCILCFLGRDNCQESVSCCPPMFEMLRTSWPCLSRVVVGGVGRWNWSMRTSRQQVFNSSSH